MLTMDLGMLTTDFSVLNMDLADTLTAVKVDAAVCVVQRSRIRKAMQPYLWMVAVNCYRTKS